MYISFSHLCKVSEPNDILCAGCKKDKISGQNRPENTYLKMLILKTPRRSKDSGEQKGNPSSQDGILLGISERLRRFRLDGT